MHFFLVLFGYSRLRVIVRHGEGEGGRREEKGGRHLFVCLLPLDDFQITLFSYWLDPVYALAMDGDRQPGPIRIAQEHLVAALRETRPSVSASERQRYNQMYAPCS